MKKPDGILQESMSPRQLRGMVERGNASNMGASLLERPRGSIVESGGLIGGSPLKAGHQVGHGALDVIESVDKDRVSFDEAADALRSFVFRLGGVETQGLDGALDEAIKMHERWGYVHRMVYGGDFRSKDAYRANLRKATVDRDDLRFVQRNLQERRYHFLPIFDPRLENQEQLVQTLFKNAGIRHSFGDDEKQLAMLRTRKIDLSKDPEWRRFGGKPRQEQTKKLKELYKQAPESMSSGPILTFTGTHATVARTHASAVDEMQAVITDGMKFLSPGTDVWRFRMMLEISVRQLAEDAEKNIDTMTPEDYQAFVTKLFADRKIDKHVPDYSACTFYPEYVTEDGMMVRRGFRRENGLFQETVEPDYSSGYMGARSCYGSVC